MEKLLSRVSGSIPLISVPPSVIFPLSISQNLAASFALVDFPPPEGPTRAVTCALMLLAALQGVSTEMYEAADIDGARFFQKLFYITIPSIRNTIYVTLLLRVIWVANSIDIIQNMTAGGPAYVTQTIGIYVYQKARVLNLGYASALAVIMTIILLAVSVPYLRYTFRQIDD